MKSFLLGAKTEVKPALPYDAEVEYLESNGTQYIDAVFVPTFYTKTEIKFRRNVLDSVYRTPMSERISAGGNGSFSVSVAYSGAAKSSYAFHRTDNQYGDRAVGLDIVSELGNGLLIENGVSMSFTRWTDFVSSGLSLYLFGRNANGTFGNGFVGRIYYCKLTDNGALVRDFIPVRKDGVGYMYDRVSGDLFGNSGTGEFVIGPDKEVA